jgi:hypothetical protein
MPRPARRLSHFPWTLAIIFQIVNALFISFDYAHSRGLPTVSSRVLSTLPSPAFLCDNPLPAVPFSTNRDLLFTLAVLKDVWYDITLLSIRTCGCRARIVLVTNPTKTFEPHFERIIKMTGTEIWRREIVTGTVSTDMYRQWWICGFLEEHVSEFDRVFMFDAFDCFFHRDPFELLRYETMAFAQEGWLIKDAGLNGGWIESCFNRSVLMSIANQPTLCSGTIYGPAPLFLKFVKLLTQKRWWKQCVLDQPILNVLVATGVLKSEGIPYVLLTCSSPVLTLSNCHRRITGVGKAREVFNGADIIPSVVHQWKSFEDFAELYAERCDMAKKIKELEARLGKSLNWSLPEIDE